MYVCIYMCVCECVCVHYYCVQPFAVAPVCFLNFHSFSFLVFLVLVYLPLRLCPLGTCWLWDWFLVFSALCNYFMPLLRLALTCSDFMAALFTPEISWSHWGQQACRPEHQNPPPNWNMEENAQRMQGRTRNSGRKQMGRDNRGLWRRGDTLCHHGQREVTGE